MPRMAGRLGKQEERGMLRTIVTALTPSTHTALLAAIKAFIIFATRF
jgi:hypothetical protein